jgi:hypothetical protein
MQAISEVYSVIIKLRSTEVLFLIVITERNTNLFIAIDFLKLGYIDNLQSFKIKDPPPVTLIWRLFVSNINNLLFYRVSFRDFVELFCSSFISYTLERYRS